MATYVEIASVTVGSGGAASIVFSSIPSDYTDLKVVCSLRNNNADTDKAIEVRFNASTSSYTDRTLMGTGSSAISFSTAYSYAGASVGNTATSNTFNNMEIYIPNYLSSNYKSFSTDTVNENNNTGAIATLNAGLWSNTSAITSIGLYDGSAANWMQYSTAYLYGIKKD